MPRYHLDFGALTLAWLWQKIESHELVPARQCLKEEMPERYAVLRGAGIDTVADLVRALKDRAATAQFAEETGLPNDYVVWLGREARSYRPNPFALPDIPETDPALLASLEAVGVKTTKALFDRAAGAADRKELATSVEAREADLLDLVKLCDLARIRGMGKTFVGLFAAAGADCADVLAKEEPSALHERLHAVNERRDLSSAVPSLKDVTEYVEMAKELPKDLEI